MGVHGWTSDRASRWYVQQPWLVGCNFIPSTAINQLEMWQADTFDLQTIHRQLGWQADQEGFEQPISAYLRTSTQRDLRREGSFQDRAGA